MTAASNSGKYVDFDEYVGLKLERTQSTIRTTDLLTALAGVAAMFLGYLLLFVVLDQWVVYGGFNVFWRWVLLSTLMVSTVTWLVYKVGIPSFRTVNGLFAAQEIEKAEPELKSNLLNLIDLKEAGRKINPQILKSMERQAAVRLQKIDVAQVIDHKPLVHTAYLLLAVIVVFCCYALLSPKKISNSIWRGLLPAAQVPLSTVTEIIDVKPGDITIPAHQPVVNVQVDLAGEIPAQVWLLYTTADGKQDQPVELRTEQEGQPRYVGQIIGDNTQGLTHDLSYFVRAGDAISKTYKITVEQPPYAEIENLRVEFPAYMKLQPIEQQRVGAIDAWEGAKVTLTAKTNMPVRSGTIQFLDDPAAPPTGEEVIMSTSHQGMQLQATWTLALRSDGSYPKYYRIHCKTEDGRVTTGHVILPQTIRPDLPPEVVLLQPDRDLEAPANATIPLLIQARDPDFELGYLYLSVEKAGQKILHDKISEGRQSKLSLKHDLELPLFNPAVGETIEFWIEAYDNKQPRPNSRNTPKIKIQIVAPVSQKEADKQLAEQKDKRDQKLAEAEQEMNADRREPGQPGDGNPQDRKSRDSDAARPNDAEPAHPENPKDQQPQNGEQGAQQSKKQNPTGNQDPNQAQGQGSGTPQKSSQGGAGENQDKGSEKQSGHESDQNKSLKNDGSQDDEALRRINERIKKNQSQKPGNSGDSSDAPQPDPAGASDKNQKEQPASKNGQKDQSPKPGQDPSRDQPGDRSKSDQQKPADEGSKPEGNKPEGNKPNGEPSAKRDEGNPNSNKPEMNEPAKGEKQKGEKESADSKSGTETKNEKNSDTNQSMKDQGSKPDQGEKPAGAGEKERPDQKDPSGAAQMNDKQEKPEASNDKNSAEAKPGTQSQQKAGDNPNEKSSKDEKSETGQGDSTSKGKPSGDKSSGDKSSSEKNEKSSGQNPSAKDEPGKSKPGQPDPNSKSNGPKEQVPDSPDSRKGKPDGTEKGVAKPDRDPNSQPSPAMNDEVKRDQNEKPEVRPGDPKPDPAEAQKDGQKGAADHPKDQGQPSGKEESSGKKNSESSGSKSKENGQANGEKAGTGEDSKPAEGGQKAKMPQESSDEKPSNESGSKKQDPGEGTKKSPGKPQSESKPGENGTADDKGGKDSKSGTDKPENQNPKASAKDSPDQQKAADQQKATDKPMDNEAKSKDENASNEKPSGDSGPKSESAQGDKKGGDKQQQKSADQSEAKSDKGGNSKSKSGQGKPSQSGSDKSDSEEGKGEPSNGENGKGKPSSKPGTKSGSGEAGGAGAQGDSTQTQGGQTSETPQSEDANLEYNRQATELILQKLKKDLERGDADPELLKELGWTPDEMKKFADRLSKSLNESKQVEETAEGKARQQQFQEMLKNLDLKSAGNRRSGENEPKRDVNQIESKRSQPPAAYRSVFEKFTKDLARQKAQSKESSSK